MGVDGNFRTRSELRRKPRRQFNYRARILTSGKASPVSCEIADISESGARIVLANEQDLPDRFVLLLTAGGEARRICRVIWRDGLRVGVEFPHAHS